jgi:hypothetical protein
LKRKRIKPGDAASLVFFSFNPIFQYSTIPIFPPCGGQAIAELLR